jgi:hypothetical protein
MTKARPEAVGPRKAAPQRRRKLVENMTLDELRAHVRRLERRNAWLLGRLLDAGVEQSQLAIRPDALLDTDVDDTVVDGTEVIPFACIYFIANGALVKIGWTRDLRLRLESLRAMSAVPFELLGFIEIRPATHTEALRAERGVQERFRDLRRHGEWFALDHNIARTAIVELGGTLGGSPSS